MIQLKISLMDISRLKPHEKYIDDRVEHLIKEIKEDGVLKKPVVAENMYNVVLDGHHRVEAFKRMGFTTIPVAIVDYRDPRIVVKSWNNGRIYNKEEVLRQALAGKLLPPRTTRHVILLNDREFHISEILPELNIPLEGLEGRLSRVQKGL